MHDSNDADTEPPKEKAAIETPDVDDAVQVVNVLLEMVWLLLLTVVLPETVLETPNMYE